MAKNKLLVCALGAAMLLGGCSIFDNTTSNNGGEVPSTTSQNGENTTPIEVTTPEVTTPEITPSTPEVPPSTSVDTNNYVETNEYHGLIEPCMNIFYSLSIDMNTIQGKAFYVAQALIFGDLYVQEINGCSLGLVSAKYPSTHNYTNVFGIQIDENNYNSWDVILHEYGHFIQGKLELSNSNGQSHIVTEDLIARYGKTSGVRLSWAEAFPNVISVIITEYFYNYIPYVDYINDGQYNTIGSNGIMWALKIEEKELINSIGEGCESDIGNILYDIYDPTNESFDKICLGHSVFWNTLKNSKAKTLSDFVQYCYLSLFQ